MVEKTVEKTAADITGQQVVYDFICCILYMLSKIRRKHSNCPQFHYSEQKFGKVAIFQRFKTPTPIRTSHSALYALHFFPHVCFYVSPQIPCFGGSETTLVAFVRLFSSVSFHMGSQITCLYRRHTGYICKIFLLSEFSNVIKIGFEYVTVTFPF